MTVVDSEPVVKVRPFGPDPTTGSDRSEGDGGRR
jgi:hypothetical protein